MAQRDLFDRCGGRHLGFLLRRDLRRRIDASCPWHLSDPVGGVDQADWFVHVRPAGAPAGVTACWDRGRPARIPHPTLPRKRGRVGWGRRDARGPKAQPGAATTAVACVTAAACRRARRLLRQCRYRSVVRSVVRLTAEQKPNTAQNAVNTQLKRSMTATVSAKAARPASLRIARVLPPLVSARRAIRATSRGPSESLRPSSVARVPAFARTRPTSRIMVMTPSARSSFTASRAMRSASAGAVIDALLRATPKALVSTTSRTDRVIHSATGAANRPVLRAALTNDRPTRSGAAAPRLA